MIRFVLALVVLLGVVASTEAHPFASRRRSVPVAPRSFHGFDSRGFDHDLSRGIRGFDDVLVTRTFVDRFGRIRTGLFDSRGRLVQVIR